MKRLHVNLSVKDIEVSKRFYEQLFGAKPTVVKEDYAKWMLDEPSVNFAIAVGDENHGVRHLGIQAENENELAEVYQNFARTESHVLEQGHTVCCYAQSEKSWVKDPQGVEWEAFHTYGEADVIQSQGDACCDDTCCS